MLTTKLNPTVEYLSVVLGTAENFTDVWEMLCTPETDIIGCPGKWWHEYVYTPIQGQGCRFLAEIAVKPRADQHIRHEVILKIGRNTNHIVAEMHFRDDTTDTYKYIQINTHQTTTTSPLYKVNGERKEASVAFEIFKTQLQKILLLFTLPQK